MKKSLLFYFISITLLSCDSKKTTLNGSPTLKFKDDSTIESVFLKYSELNQITESLLHPNKMIICNNYLILNEKKGNKPLHVISIPHDKYLGKFGNKGKGPGELLIPWRFSVSDKVLLVILDPQLKKIIDYDIDSLVLNQKFNKEYKLNPNARLNSASIYSDKIYYPDQNNQKFQLYESDFYGTNNKGYGNMLIKDEKFHKKMILGDLSRSIMVNKKNIFAFSFYNYPLIRIYNIEENKWVSIVGPEEDIQLFENFNFSTVAYADIRITNKHIYALYKGGEKNANTIFVFNSEGQTIKKLSLEKGIITFDIFEDKFIYGISNDDDGYKLLKYEVQND